LRRSRPSRATNEPALRRAGGWISSRRATLEDIRAGVVTVRSTAEKAGKSLDAVRWSSEASPPCARHPSPTATAFRLRGSLEQIRDDLHRFAGCGVDEVFLDLNFDSELVGGPDADPARAMHPATAVLRWASRLKRAHLRLVGPRPPRRICAHTST
jgi:hypothetical protein